jgi:hypothetical protein
MLTRSDSSVTPRVEEVYDAAIQHKITPCKYHMQYYYYNHFLPHNYYFYHNCSDYQLGLLNDAAARIGHDACPLSSVVQY